MLNVFKSVKQLIGGKKSDTEEKTVSQAMWDDDYLSLENNFYNEISGIIQEGLISSEGFDQLPLGEDIQELYTNLTILVKHGESVIEYLETVEVTPYTSEYAYVVAVMRLFSDMTASMGNFLRVMNVEPRTPEKMTGLQKVTKDYFNFMTSVHDHIQDAKIDDVLKAELNKYYSKYVNSTFFV